MALSHVRRNRLERGLCLMCGGSPFVEGKTLCQKCLDKHRQYSAKYRKKLKEKGIKPNNTSSGNINYRQKIINKGLCLECLELIKDKLPEQLYCSDCKPTTNVNASLATKTEQLKIYDNKNDRYFYVKENLINERFGKLLILDFSHMNYSSQYWVCQCDCGNIEVMLYRNIKTKQCCSECRCQDGE